MIMNIPNLSIWEVARYYVIEGQIDGNELAESARDEAMKVFQGYPKDEDILMILDHRQNESEIPF